MDRADVMLPLLLGIPLGAQLGALWLGLWLRPKLGWPGQVLAVLLPPAAALLLLYALVPQSAPCPSEQGMACGEVVQSLSFVGLACAGANLLFAIPVQLGVRAWLRDRHLNAP